MGCLLLNRRFFEGDYHAHAHAHAHAQAIRSVMGLLKSRSLHASYYEIPSGERYSGNASLPAWKIDATIVSAILAAADAEVEKQLDNNLTNIY